MNHTKFTIEAGKIFVLTDIYSADSWKKEKMCFLLNIV